MHDLGCRMDAGVRSTGTVYGHRLLCDLPECPFQFSLNRMAVRLPLPTAKALAVIFDGEGDSLFCQSRSVALVGHEILRSKVSASVTCSGLPLLTISSSALLAESLSPMSI